MLDPAGEKRKLFSFSFIQRCLSIGRAGNKQHVVGITLFVKASPLSCATNCKEANKTGEVGIGLVCEIQQETVTCTPNTDKSVRIGFGEDRAD